MERSESIGALAAALAEAQGEFPVVAKESSNPFFKSKYAELSTIVRTIQPVLRKHGLSVTQLTEDGENGVSVRTVLMHKTGEYISGVLRMRPVKDDPQGIGSAITYARRYGLSAILGIATDDDDDGAAASGTTSKSQTQKKQEAKKTPPADDTRPTAEEKAKVWNRYLKVVGNQQHAINAAKKVTGGKGSSDWTRDDLNAIMRDADERESMGIMDDEGGA